MIPFKQQHVNTPTLTQQGQRNLLADPAHILESSDDTQLQAALGEAHGQLVDPGEEMHHPIVVRADVQAAQTLIVAALIEMRESHCAGTCKMTVCWYIEGTEEFVWCYGKVLCCCGVGLRFYWSIRR
ncbi:hypothetical protein E2C01_087350 [Portunus trituberculatus]|uniref:Uncharacterized protein n=1 Tax=Portunus trituberculatus TaxID=210409 RepID=A0A5B7J335_PORTR|nr:hypothetical protein [Portunus trituberculatus]